MFRFYSSQIDYLQWDNYFSLDSSGSDFLKWET